MIALRKERERRGWSLTDVCQRTGIAPTTISEIERGMRFAYPGWRRRFSKAFGIPEAVLFAEVEND